MFEINYEILFNKNELSSERQSSINRSKLFPRNNATTKYFKTYSNRTSATEQNENAAYYQIASLIPDEVLLNSSNYKMRAFEAVVMFADISGFTDLCEKYRSLEYGASKLSAVLNSYLGIMVQEILSRNGDVIKYAGDAFIAIFRKDVTMSIQNSIHNSIDTAIIIQKNCQNFKTEVGVTLNVKIAISCGEVDFQLIGDESSSHYVMIGDPVWQVKSLQELISAGEILVTWKAMYYAQEWLYTHEMIRAQRCYKITGFKEQQGLAQRQYEANLNFQDLQKNLNKSIDIKSSSNLFLESGFDTLNLAAPHNEIFSLRQHINLITSNEVRKALRRFIITPVLNAINMGDNIDSLTEMRCVVVVFVNFIVLKKKSKALLLIVDEIYKKLYSIVNAFEGVLNKVFLFDKDMMFLVIFGLRGLQHENEAEIALRCGRELFDTFSSWNDISKVSIGITTGQSYCGVVGHTLRREYSVISVAVNRAARLMIAYPHMVSCDQETLIQSKISLQHFKLLPKRKLKGIGGYISVFEFCDTRNSTVDFLNLDDDNIIYGRNELINEINQKLAVAIDNFDSYNDSSSYTSCVMLKGESGVGKTKLINFFLPHILEHKIRCIKLLLNTKHSSVPFWMLKNIFTRFIETEYESEEQFKLKITKKFQRLNIHQYLYLFNEIIDTNFNESNLDLNEQQKLEVQQLIISIFLKNLKNFWVILINDADYIDSYSLKFINSIISSPSVFTILSIGKNYKKWTLQQGKFIINEHVTQYNLGPIDKTFQKDIACQSLNVSAIPIEFERFLHKNSNGNAGWIETCAKTLLYSGKLKIKTLSHTEAVDDGVVMSNNNGHDDIFNLNPTSTAHLRHDSVINVAVIEGELCKNDFVVGYKSNKLMVYDTLSSFDQMICKYASVIGPKFSRNELISLTINIDQRSLGLTVAKLFKLSILFCASKDCVKDTEVNLCDCKKVEIFESCRDLPKYANCSYMTFNDEMFRRHVYETLTEKQRIEYHRKCISFLCRTTKRCSSCGNRKFQPLEEIKNKFCDGRIKSDSDTAKKDEINLRYLLHCNDGTSRKKPIILNYLRYEHRSCTCNFLLNNALNNIVQHCQGKDMIMKKIFSKIEVADVSIKTGNIPNALHFLNLTIELLNVVSDSDTVSGNSLLLVYLRGKALILQGFCCDSIGQYRKARTLYYSACKIFKISFPSAFNTMARLMLVNLTQKVKKRLNSWKKGAQTRYQMMISHQSSFLLQNMYKNLSKSGEKELASLAAVWSLKDALNSNSDISVITACFKNILVSGSQTLFRSLEKRFFGYLLKSSLCQNIDRNSLEKIIEFYTAIMEHEIYRQNIKTAINFGEFAKKMCYNIGNHEALSKVIPPLFILYMKSFRIDECHKLLQELHYSIKFNSNNEYAKIWFYALCMDLYLDTNIDCIVEYDECKNIFLEAISIEMSSEACLRFIVNFKLWNVRKGQRNDLQPRELAVMEKFFVNETLNVNLIFTGIRILELIDVKLNEAKFCSDYEYYQRLNGLIKRIVKKHPVYKIFWNKLKVDI